MIAITLPQTSIIKCYTMRPSFGQKVIIERFDQPGYKIYRNLENVILNTCRSKNIEDELEFVYSFYDDDLVKYQLRAQLRLLFELFRDIHQSEKEEIKIHSIVKCVGNLALPQQLAFPQVFTLMKLLLINNFLNKCFF